MDLWCLISLSRKVVVAWYMVRHPLFPLSPTYERTHMKQVQRFTWIGIHAGYFQEGYLIVPSLTTPFIWRVHASCTWRYNCTLNFFSPPFRVFFVAVVVHTPCVRHSIINLRGQQPETWMYGGWLDRYISMDQQYYHNVHSGVLIWADICVVSHITTMSRWPTYICICVCLSGIIYHLCLACFIN